MTNAGRRLLGCTPAFVLVVLVGCGQSVGGVGGAPVADDAELLLPDGFEATVVADSIGPARHIAVNDNGDIYVKLRASAEAGSIVALRDTTGDGRADRIERFWTRDEPGNYHTGIEIHNGYLYFSSNLRVYRAKLTPGELLPREAMDTIVIDDHARLRHQHQQKPLAFDDDGHVYVPFGTPTDVCQEPDRVPATMGREPCPDLEQHGGIWRFDADGLNQTQADGTRYAMGIRSTVALDWNPVDGQLYAAIHGRDYLHTMWPNLYSPWHNAVLPAEEFVRSTEGSDFGWPFCYYDQLRGVKVLGPEYGGDGETVGRCAEYHEPLIGFPGHFAPSALLFYHGDQFPEHYEHGAFITFHGSTIRSPYPQAGYFVAFVPFEGGEPSGDWEVFSNGFSVIDPIVSTGDAHHRPVGLATGPDGSLYITESVRGKIWRIRFTGDRDAFGPENLARLEQEKRQASNVKDPDQDADRLQERLAIGGEAIYQTYCAGCHQRNGRGAVPRFPPLAGTDWVTGDKGRLIQIILGGWDEPIEVDGYVYAEHVMPKHGFLTDDEIAEVATHIRRSFGNDADAVTASQVRDVRDRLP
ncbi:MAG: PQQ-dependent sugar dehydrogenase [Longimicrobiales bacterium]